ncbi:hypothetical protein OnM2_041057 [Erysiphe neolycopersici]|uniref:Integrase catalytic domain-containing protein n=1 Tax=Erysiphe neolycopersici TaxID=212602 RepID=A0A420HVP5_9PEZI|nr:hypothetical protein OnM2_041057 [Erysiphe neolycopersici]
MSLKLPPEFNQFKPWILVDKLNDFTLNPTAAEADAGILHTFIAQKIAWYSVNDKCNRTIINLLQDFLVKHGVYVPRDRRTGNDAKLLASLKETQVHEWTHEEAVYQIKHGGGFSPKFDPFFGEVLSIKQASKDKDKVYPSSIRELPENMISQNKLTSESKRIFDNAQQKSQVLSSSQAHSNGSSRQLIDLERLKAGFLRFQQQSYFQGEPVTPEYYQTFLAEWEGVEGFTGIENEVDQFLESWGNEFDDLEFKNEQLLTEYGPLDPYHVVKHLNNQSALHAITRKDIFKDLKNNKSSSFSSDLSNSTWQQNNTFLSRYSEYKFQGIIPDTGAAGVPSVQINKNRAGEHQIRFGKGEAILIGTVEANTPIGKIFLRVVPLHTPFLLCLQDMKQMGVYLNNLENVLVRGQKIVPIIIKFGHPFLLLNQAEESVAFSHLIEIQLRRLHRRFGHPSRTGHDIDNKAVEKLTHFCRQFQLHGKAPGRFKFKPPKEHDFNHTVVVDIVNLEGDNTLNVVDEATNYQAGRFLTDMSTATVWNAFRASWIETYLEPPDSISHDAGTNLAS